MAEGGVAQGGQDRGRPAGPPDPGSARRPAGRLRGLPAAAVRSFRRSLQLRVVALTLLLCLVALGVLGSFLGDQIGQRLLDARRQQAFEDAATAATTFQNRLDQADVPTAVELDRFIEDQRGQLESVGGDASEGVLLLRSPRTTEQVVVNSLSSAGPAGDVLPPALQEAVQTEDEQQSVALDLPRGTGTVPGLVVGQRVTLPLAGEYELYFFVDLVREQETLAAVQRVLAVGGLLLVLLVGGVAAVVTSLVVRPVREAAGAAARLSAGDLDQRLDVRGEDDLARLGRSFNEMAASLQLQITQLGELSRLQQRFVSDVSHELRTPLTTMRMAGEVLHDARGDLDPAAARSAELLQTQLDRFEALLADLLEMSRFDAGAAALDAERVDVAALVARVVEHAAPLADAAGVRVDVRRPTRPATAQVEGRRVERVLRNLVANAVEHAEGRPVEVDVGVDPGAVAVLVRDHGVGLRPAEAARVFDRFWRADPARARTTGGSGLGLAISLEDVLLHGGRLEVVGRPGEGSAFRLTLPRTTGPLGPGSPLAMPLDLEPVAADDPVSRPVALGGVPGTVLVRASAGRTSADDAQDRTVPGWSQDLVDAPAEAAGARTSPPARVPAGEGPSRD